MTIIFDPSGVASLVIGHPDGMLEPEIEGNEAKKTGTQSD